MSTSNAISQWLGHASPNTTNRYATIDLEMKRRAIAKVNRSPSQYSSWRETSLFLNGWRPYKHSVMWRSAA